APSTARAWAAGLIPEGSRIRNPAPMQIAAGFLVMEYRKMATPDPNHVRIFDTTLRDGEQSPGCSMTLVEKLRVARALADLGVDIIEAGFPAASEGDWESVNAVAREVQGPTICGLARC